MSKILCGWSLLWNEQWSALHDISWTQQNRWRSIAAIQEKIQQLHVCRRQPGDCVLTRRTWQKIVRFGLLEQHTGSMHFTSLILHYCLFVPLVIKCRVTTIDFPWMLSLPSMSILPWDKKDPLLAIRDTRTIKTWPVPNVAHEYEHILER